MVSSTYAYAIGCLILFIIWILIFAQRKDLRPEMLWAGFLGMPFGLIDFFLVPMYWNPDSLFDLIEKYGVGIESFVFLFLMASLAAVIYQFLFKRKAPKPKRSNHHHIVLLLATPILYVILSVIFPLHAIYNVMIVGAAGALATAYLRKDLRKQILTSAYLFSLLYLGVFVLVNLICDGWVGRFYNLENTWGILIWGVPLEEIAVAFFAGAFWSTIYEYTNSYRGK
ncbi:MAG: hypothetical protein QG640_190 [Patescibacteria group bacterium]|nr:hypothetical protein [Patescibacteria group bacterium]